MGTDSVEEPAVVADYHRTTGKCLQTFLQGTEGVHVDIVGRLIEEQYVAFLLQCQCQLQTVTLTTRENTAELALVGAREVEAADVSTCIHISATQTQGFVALGNHLVNSLLRVDVLVLLVNISQLHGLTHLECAAICLIQAHNEAEEGSLTGSVRTNHTYDAVRRKHEVEVVEENLFAERLLYMLSLNHLVAQTRTVRDEDFQLLLALLLLLVEHLLVRVQTSLTLSLTCLRCHANPFQLTLQSLAALRGSLLLLNHSLGLLVEPRRVVALPWNTLATVQLQNPLAHVVEEVAVVGYGDDRTLILLQVLLQPVDALSIQVVGRLIE